MFRGLFSWIGDKIDGVRDFFLDRWQAVLDWAASAWSLVEKWLADVVTWATQRVPPEAVEILNNPPWEHPGVVAALETVAFFFPLAAAFTIIVGTYTTLGTIRLVRTLIDLLPTWLVGGG